MELYVIRHAWAREHGDPRWPDDRLRPLTEEGRDRFHRMMDRLVKRGVVPQVIATSPMTRCVETAQVVAETLAEKVDVVELEDLLPGGDLDRLLRWTERQASNCQQVAWVGHAPDVDRLAAELLGTSASNIRFSKGAIAALSFDGPLGQGEAELRWMVTAKILGF